MDVKAGSGAFLPERERARGARARDRRGRRAATAWPARRCSPTWTRCSAARPATRSRCARSLDALTHPRAADPRLRRGHARAVRDAAAARRPVRDGRGRRAPPPARRSPAAPRPSASRAMAARARRARGPARRPRTATCRGPARARGRSRPSPGTSRAIDVREVGVAVLELGGGRRREDEAHRPRRRPRPTSPGWGRRSARAAARWPSSTPRDEAAAERAAERAARGLHGRRRARRLPPLTEAAVTGRRSPSIGGPRRSRSPSSTSTSRARRTPDARSAGSRPATASRCPPGTIDGDRFVWRDFLDFLAVYDRAVERHPHRARTTATSRSSTSRAARPRARSTSS